MADLNARQLLFVEEYVVDLNATQAAIRAGYAAENADVTGPRLLGNVGIAEAIAERKAERLDRLRIEQSEVVEWLANVLRANVSDVVQWGPDGVELTSSSSLPPAVLSAVKEVSEGPAGRIRIVFHDKGRVAELLARHLGMLNDKLNLDVTSGGLSLADIGRILSDEA